MKYILEICSDSVPSAIAAQEAGAHRIELCDNLPEGGTTPGPGKILSARSNLDIRLHVLVRPRGGDFLYTDIEYDQMRRDIEFCGEAGADGIVTGILLPDGRIDVDRTARLAELARPMSVTFHRAFDLCSDPIEGLEEVIESGADRLLTSGHANKVTEGIELVRKLTGIAGSRLTVMPGSGINETNIEAVARGTGALEFHLTGRKSVQSEMEFRRSGISMGAADTDEYSLKVADPQRIIKICNILKMI